MINLQPHKDGYRYRTGEVGEVVEVEVTYYKDMRKRGVYVAVRPITLKDGMMSYVLTSGTTKLALELGALASISLSVRLLQAVERAQIGI
jgi:hypothetical protein